MSKPVINRHEAPTPYEAALAFLRPLIKPSLALVPSPRFTTRQFVMYLRATEPGEEAYTQAVSRWPTNFTLGRQTIHGQIIPQLLREEAGASWAGYVYNDPDEEDGLSVPSAWLKPGYAYPDE